MGIGVDGHILGTGMACIVLAGKGLYTDLGAGGSGCYLALVPVMGIGILITEVATTVDAQKSLTDGCRALSRGVHAQQQLVVLHIGTVFRAHALHQGELGSIQGHAITGIDQDKILRNIAAWHINPPSIAIGRLCIQSDTIIQIKLTKATAGDRRRTGDCNRCIGLNSDCRTGIIFIIVFTGDDGASGNICGTAFICLDANFLAAQLAAGNIACTIIRNSKICSLYLAAGHVEDAFFQYIHSARIIHNNTATIRCITDRQSARNVFVTFSIPNHIANTDRSIHGQSLAI